MTKRTNYLYMSFVLLMLALWSTAASAQLASGPWPMFRHDIRHSGVSPYHDPTPGGTAWIRSVGGGLSSPVIASDGTIYIGGGLALYALNSDGSVKWSQAMNISTRSTPAIGSDGTIYIGGNGRLYAFSSAGVQKWTFTVSGEVTSSPVIGPDGTVYVGSRGGYLYAITPGATSATPKWSLPFRTGDIHMSSPVISSDGSTLYVGGGGKLWALSTSDGGELWSYSVGSTMTSSAAISADGSTIYIGSYDGNLYAVSSSGNLVWKIQVGFKNASTSSSPAVGPDGTIYIGSNYGSLYAITPAGVQLWIFETRSDIRSSVAINADGTLFVGSYDGYLHALNSATGAEKWHYLLTGGNYPSPAIAADGTVVAATIGGVVFGNLNSTPPTATPPSDLTLALPTSTSVALAWTDNSSDEYGFRIERRIGTVGAYTFLANVTTGPSYTDPGLQSGMTYYYRVCAYQAGGLSGYTNEESIDTPGLMTPTGLVATPVSESQVDLTWTDRSSDELGFSIERSTGPNGLFEQVALVGQNVGFYSDLSPYPATNYYYRVRAYDATRWSSYSNVDWALTSGKDFTEIMHGDTSRKQMALTFDAGTAAIRTGLSTTLKNSNVFSTFFITGYVTEVQKTQVAQIARDGHLIGNHSYDHPDLRFCTPEQINWQLDITDDIIYAASGHHTRSYFRAPYGAKDDYLLDVAADNGFRHVNWTLDSADVGGVSTQTIIDRTLNGAENGAIVLYHCTVGNTETAIPTVITGLRDQGYELVTIPELVAPKQVTSPPGELNAGWNLISLPIEPALPFPHIVFRGLPIDSMLVRWDKPSASDFPYSALSPETFGNMDCDQGYWLWMDSPGAIKFNGADVPGARHIKLPEPPANRYACSLIGYPFDTAQEFSNCTVYNPNAPDPKTRSVLEAIDLGWIPCVFFAIDSATQSQYDVSVPEYWPYSTQLEPWHGYLATAFAPGIELIIPKPR